MSDADPPPCSPKKRLESAVETDRFLTKALDEVDGKAIIDAGAAGSAAAEGGGGGGPVPVGEEPAT